MPVNPVLLAPALAIANGATVGRRARFDTSLGIPRGGAAAPYRDPMRDAVDEYFAAPTYRITNRWADDINGIDAAANTLRNTWNPNAFPAHLDCQAVEAVLRACAAWLGGIRPTITSWRTATVRTLYWKVAFVYGTHTARFYSEQRVTLDIAAGVATSAMDIAVPGHGGLNFNPYAHADYTPTPSPGGGAVGALLRGINLAPVDMHGFGGFLPRNRGTNNYYPWFEGNALADTISTTAQQALAVNAHWQNGAPVVVANPPAWLVNYLPVGTYRGFVYEFGNLGAAQSVRMTTEPYGREEIFLSVPNACITRWWVVNWADKRTFGPFLWFPAAGGAGPAPAAVPVLPAVVPQWSAAPRQLHY